MAIDKHQEALELWEELARQFGVLLDVTRNSAGILISPKADEHNVKSPVKPAETSLFRSRSTAVKNGSL